MNSAHGPCACAARSRSNATSCSAWWRSRSIKYSASPSSGPRRPERRPLRPREHRENSPRSMNFARGSSDEFVKLLLRTLVQIAMLTSSVFLETSIPNIPSITVLSFHLVCLRELRFEQPCTQDLRSRASQDTVQSEQRSLEKRGLIYRTGSFAKGTTEAHRSPRCSANMFTCQAVRNVQGAEGRPTLVLKRHCEVKRLEACSQPTRRQVACTSPARRYLPVHLNRVVSLHAARQVFAGQMGRGSPAKASITKNVAPARPDCHCLTAPSGTKSRLPTPTSKGH